MPAAALWMLSGTHETTICWHSLLLWRGKITRNATENLNNFARLRPGVKKKHYNDAMSSLRRHELESFIRSIRNFLLCAVWLFEARRRKAVITIPIDMLGHGADTLLRALCLRRKVFSCRPASMCVCDKQKLCCHVWLYYSVPVSCWMRKSPMKMGVFIR